MRGLIFVTYVPDAPFQILGRRAPDGELCVGQKIFPLKEGGWRGFLRYVQDFGGIEIVTGLEAENLIQALVVECKRFSN